MDYLLREEVTDPSSASPSHWQSRPRRMQDWSFEWKSKRTVRGIPLVHIHFGIGRTAKGIFAVGLAAKGVCAVGIFSMGLLSFGVFSLGLLALGALSLGGLSAGALAIGLLAFGGIALGIVACGGVPSAALRQAVLPLENTLP